MTLMMELKEQRREGREEGRAEEQLASIRSLMKKLGLTAEKAMDVLDIPADKQKEYAEML